MTARQTPPLPAFALIAAEALLIALLAIALARFAWALITPAGPVGPPATATAQPLPGPDALAAYDPFFRIAPASSPASVSSLDLTLVGTRVDQATARGSAIITLPDDTQSSFAVGDEVLPGVRLAAVSFDAITLDNNGTREELFLDQSSSTTPPTPPSAIQPPPAATTSPSTPRLAAELQAEPRLTDGRLTGFVLNPRGAGTAFAAAGLQPGDVLTQIDGTPVANLGNPAAIARRVEAGGGDLVIDRAGQPLAVQLPPAGARP